MTRRELRVQATLRNWEQQQQQQMCSPLNQDVDSVARTLSCCSETVRRRRRFLYRLRTRPVFADQSCHDDASCGSDGGDAFASGDAEFRSLVTDYSRFTISPVVASDASTTTTTVATPSTKLSAAIDTKESARERLSASRRSLHQHLDTVLSSTNAVLQQQAHGQEAVGLVRMWRSMAYRQKELRRAIVQEFCECDGAGPAANGGDKVMMPVLDAMDAMDAEEGGACRAAMM